MSNAIQALLREPKVELILDMGLGSREQGFAAHPPKRKRLILSKPAQPCLEQAADL